ncbi:MAG: pSer/pThr/pTyr-binding forkhead associated (FHA) protein [Limisphaerales bacterium]|jgi:pSer/pThr/pTyr-binding forkhead associated (FHA) protein
MYGSYEFMRLLLTPISNPELGEIVVESSLFAIGRREEPFTRAIENARKLSRRHARIFLEDAKVYLADLGSLNGTKVNGAVLGNDARVLNEGDIVEFGGAFTFKVSISRPVELGANAQSSSQSLVLVAEADTTFENIVIEHFPFMINRDDQMFSQFQPDYPDDVRRISRRHALFVLKGDEIHLEDLDSSNGTFVNGEKLDEHTRALAEGDVLNFGGKRFAYTVRILHKDLTQDGDATVIYAADTATLLNDEHPERTITPEIGSSDAMPDLHREGLQDEVQDEVQDSNDPIDGAPFSGAPILPEAAPDESDKTRFVESATSFLDVFCGPLDEPLESSEIQQADSDKVAAEKPGAARSLFRSFELGRYSRVAWVFLSAVLIVVAVAATTYWSDSEVRRMKALLDEGRYTESVAAAGPYLAANKNDFDATRIGEEALVRSIVDTWAGYLAQEDYHQAELYLADSRTLASNIGRGSQMIDLLAWVGRVRQLVAERGTEVSAVSDTLIVQSLVAEWDVDQYKHRQLITQMENYEPLFRPIAAAVTSDLVQLRNNDATYGRALEQLKTTIANSLGAGLLNNIDEALSVFAVDYPTVTGIDSHERDLKQYRALLERFEANDMFELARMGRQTNMQTPVFSAYVTDWLSRTVPSEPLIAAYEKASAFWREGDAALALKTLEAADDDATGDVLQTKMDRFREIEEKYQLWVGERTPEQLLALRELLHPPEDEYYLEATQSAFTGQYDRILGEVENTYERAAAIWSSYNTAGGIPGLIRLETTVSSTFKAQSGRLQEAHAEIRQGNRQLAMLQSPAAVEWMTLELEITSEIKRQKLWLSELKLIMNSQLLAEKLALLPKLKE